LPFQLGSYIIVTVPLTPETSATVRESAAILRHAIARVVPQLRDVPVEYAGGGTLDFAVDLILPVGQPYGLYYASGYAGHGAALATFYGAHLAAMAGEATDNPFAELPFPGAPLGPYTGAPWFPPLPEVLFRFLDSVR
jgi:glycine/D-amino acid oxidase-like deaminating enzyme